MQNSKAPASVIINACNSMEAVRRVLVTPLAVSSQHHQSPQQNLQQPVPVRPRGTQVHQQQTVLEKLLLKVYSKSSKKEWKMFTLRNVDTASIKTCDDLKEEIRIQLTDDVKKDFDVGFVQGSNLISVRSSRDMAEVWGLAAKGQVTIWCDGLTASHKSRKRKRTEIESDNSSDEDFDKKSQKKVKKSRKEEREERVEESVAFLKEKHGMNFSAMQYRIWGEMVAGDLHSSLDTPPSTSMFIRAGGNTPGRKKSESSVAQVLTLIADHMSPPAVQSRPGNGTSSGASPARKIENRSKCYRQLKELHDLKSAGIVSDEQYEVEKRSIMMTLQNL